jgi:hypothetical protein
MLAKTTDFPGFLRLQPVDFALPERKKREFVGELGTPGSLPAISPVLTSALQDASVGYADTSTRRNWLMRADLELR